MPKAFDRVRIARKVSRPTSLDYITHIFEDFIEFAKLNIITNNLEKAEEILKKAIGKEPSSPVTHNLLGVISEYKGDVTQAQKYYRAALALDPTYKPAESNIRRTVDFDYTKTGIKLD